MRILVVLFVLLCDVFLPVIGKDYREANQKKGIGCVVCDCERLQKLRVSWLYDWSPFPPLCPGIEAIPMIRDPRQLDKLTSGVWQLGGNSEILLTFNEPDMTEPAGTPQTPREAAIRYRQIEALYGDRFKLASPAPSHYHRWWLEQFLAEYLKQYRELPQIDVVAVHCYDNALTCKHVLLWAEDFRQRVGADSVMLTEFGKAALFEDYEPALSFMDSTWRYCDRYAAGCAWFTDECIAGSFLDSPVADICLIDYETKELTPLGERYRGY